MNSSNSTYLLIRLEEKDSQMLHAATHDYFTEYTG